jgi:hypothetical protein
MTPELRAWSQSLIYGLCNYNLCCYGFIEGYDNLPKGVQVCDGYF